MKWGNQWSALALLLVCNAACAEYVNEYEQKSPVNAGNADCTSSDGKISCNALRCSRSSLAPGQSVVLTMTLPHGDDIVVADPDGMWIDVRNPAEKRYPDTEFEQLQTLTIEAGMQGWRSGPAPKPVFTKRGRYRILVGLGFGTDEHGIYGYCDIFYKG
ncbi:MAG TPA: hypothetical protein VM555_05945 [Tahibacter sp.]|nr:hypothetical protein [Tahibacter sp.]